MGEKLKCDAHVESVCRGSVVLLHSLHGYESQATMLTGHWHFHSDMGDLNLGTPSLPTAYEEQ